MFEWIPVLIIGFVLGVMFGSLMEMRAWKIDLVKRGLAQYNSKSGRWEWIEKHISVHDLLDQGTKK